MNADRARVPARWAMRLLASRSRLRASLGRRMDPARLRRLALGIVLVTLLAVWWLRPARSPAVAGKLDARQAALVDEFLKLEAAENAFVQREWATELEAERVEDWVFALWDRLNREADFGTILAELPLRRVRLPASPTEAAGEAGIRWENRSGAPLTEWSPADWRRELESFRQAGWKLAHSHWRVPSYRPAAAGQAALATIEVIAHLEREPAGERRVIRARLEVGWATNALGEPSPTEVEILSSETGNRAGPPPFSAGLADEIPVPRHTVFTDPLLASDLDGDGFTDLLLVGAGRLWRNVPAATGRAWAAEAYPGLPAERVWAAALVDGDRNGRPELWLAAAGGFFIAPLDPVGRIALPIQAAWTSPQPLKHPQSFAVGDVDGDGDPDAWLIQYKLPYQGGQFPTPWFDANDGFTSHLLLNEGGGRFRDATAESGLGAKARRRSYSASLLDLDGDSDLDLVNISDFAGADVFLNDGRGKFTDATASLGLARHAFGMAHAFGDVNGDARPDLLMLGMDSPVAERLNALRLDRELPGRGRAGLAQRAAMVHGNRLLVSGPIGWQGADSALAAAWQRTGWSWGCAWADFNNDARADLAVANGHETFASTRDYERQFWLHDGFIAGSTNSPLAELFFRNAAGRRKAEQGSYGGWQANRLVLSDTAGGWREAAWLLGVADAADSRNLVADDFDHDGRLDFAVTTFEQFPTLRQRLLVYRNELPPAGRHWLGVELEAVDLGARVEVATDQGRQVRWLTQGDSFRSQNPSRLHFGLGTAHPQRVEVFLPNGQRKVSANPRMDAWQRLP